MSTGNPSKRIRWVNLIGLLLLVLALVTVVVRAEIKHSEPGQIVDAQFDSNQGYRDFHNAIYFPVRAFVSGVNPYSRDYVEDYHPDDLSFPLFAPSSLLLHSYLGFFNLHVAEWLYFAVNLVLLIFIAWIVLHDNENSLAIGAVFAFSAIMIISRPGLLNFLGLQMTLSLMVGCWLALRYAHDRPALSGLGLLLACCKPTFAIPLFVIMLCRRNFSAVAYGVIFCLVANLAAIGFIANQNGGVSEFVDQVTVQYGGSFDEHPEIPAIRTSWTRLDAYSIIARWYDVAEGSRLNFFVPAAILLFGAFVTLLERNPDQRIGVNSRTGVFALLIMLTTVYHQPYDALVLWIPLAALITGNEKLEVGFSVVARWILLILMLVPMFNYVSTKLMLDRLNLDNGVGSLPDGARLTEQLVHAWPWKLIVTINAIAIVLAAIVVARRMVASRFFDQA